MKNTFLFIFILLFSYTVGNAQELDVNKVDEITKEKLKETSWETIKWSKEVCSFFRVTKKNESENFELRLLVEGGSYSVNKGQEAVFTFDNGTTITLKSDNSSTILEASMIKKIKVNTSIAVIDFEIKDTFAKNIIKALKLVD
jgi:hypothetical protein